MAKKLTNNQKLALEIIENFIDWNFDKQYLKDNTKLRARIYVMEKQRDEINESGFTKTKQIKPVNFDLLDELNNVFGVPQQVPE